MHRVRLIPVNLLVLACSVLCSWSSDVVIVVDVSGSMLGRISRTDRNVRVETVQRELANYLTEIDVGTRLYLLSFSTGVMSEMEMILQSEADRAAALGWVSGLRRQVNPSGTTHLWSSLRKGLQVASAYSTQNPDQTVKVRVLTDGMDNDPKFKGIKPSVALANLVREFPLLNDKSIRANLVLLGDMEMELGANPFPGIRVASRPTWTNIFPPKILWTPATIRVGDEVRFSYRSRTEYAFADWWIDGVPVSRSSEFPHRFTKAGTYEVRLKVTTREGEGDDFVAETVPVLEAERPEPIAPRIYFVPATPVPHEVVRLVGRANGAGLSFQWSVDGQPAGTAPEIDWTPAREGAFRIRLLVTASPDRSEEVTREIQVREPAIQPRFTALERAASGQVVQFVNETEGRVASWLWDFGDGTTSEARNPAHAFTNKLTADRAFKVVLTCKSPSGKTFSSSPREIAVTPEVSTPPPKADFRVIQEKLQVGKGAAFVDESSGRIDAYLWDFGGEGTSEEKNPSFTFQTAGEKVVRLTVRGPGGTNAATRSFPVAPRDLSARFHWLAIDGAAEAVPARLDFGAVHPTVLRRGDQLVTVPTEFEFMVPVDLPPGTGVRITVDELAANAFTIERRAGETYRPLNLPALVTESGRFRVICKTNAPVGKHSGLLLFKPEGDRVLLNDQAAVSRVALGLTVGKASMPWSLVAVLALIGLGLLVWAYRNARGGGKLYPADKPVIATLGETRPKGSPADTRPLTPPQEFTLEVGDVVRFAGSGKNCYPLNCTQAWLTRQEKRLEIAFKDERPSISVRVGQTIEVTDDDQQPRWLEISIRLSEERARSTETTT